MIKAAPILSHKIGHNIHVTRNWIVRRSGMIKKILEIK